MVQRADEILREETRPVWVRGEISGFQHHKSGHCYFTLKDDHAELACVLFREHARRLPALPEDGMEVDVFGGLGIYAARGRFQLLVTDLDRTGVGGMWQAAKERLVEQLRKEGLLDEGRKRPLPAVPECVGIVTAADSAAWHDMWRILRRKAWWTRVLVSDCTVEGPGSASSVAAAIRRFGARTEECRADVVIVARGGGSAESLWGFNLEEVARAICACPVPVISAVGHETDFTVADLVADLRAATPTAGAERAVPDGAELLETLRQLPAEMGRRAARSLDAHRGRYERETEELHRASRRRLQGLQIRVEGLGRHLEARSPRQLLRGTHDRLQTDVAGLHAAMQRQLRAHVQRTERGSDALHAAWGARVEELEAMLSTTLEGIEARSPMRVLQRGYAVAEQSDTGRIVRDAASLTAGERLRLRLSRGTVDVRVEKTYPVEEDR